MSTPVKPKAMIQDNTRCIGCRACMVACKSWNDRPEDETDFFAGGSVISAVREKFHLMLETRWSEESRLVVSPGLRWAWDLKSGFQIVPGVAVPIGDDTRSVFLYLSLER